MTKRCLAILSFFFSGCVPLWGVFSLPRNALPAAIFSRNVRANVNIEAAEAGDPNAASSVPGLTVGQLVRQDVTAAQTNHGVSSIVFLGRVFALPIADDTTLQTWLAGWREALAGTPVIAVTLIDDSNCIEPFFPGGAAGVKALRVKVNAWAAAYFPRYLRGHIMNISGWADSPHACPTPNVFCCDTALPPTDWGLNGETLFGTYDYRLDDSPNGSPAVLADLQAFRAAEAQTAVGYQATGILLNTFVGLTCAYDAAADRTRAAYVKRAYDAVAGSGIPALVATFLWQSNCDPNNFLLNSVGAADMPLVRRSLAAIAAERCRARRHVRPGGHRHRRREHCGHPRRRYLRIS